jgi:hypothetical protein
MVSMLVGGSNVAISAEKLVKLNTCWMDESPAFNI